MRMLKPLSNPPRRAVHLDARGVRINGTYTVVLCSSLFYFRVPEGLWADRMEKIKAAGYNAIDVYFPWNFHETERGEWDFSSGMRDVRSFLTLAVRYGLYVVARPGPYICSEWDGGGLPAHLLADGVDIRQNDPVFLARTGEWFRRILPVIAENQIDRGGAVILVQIENELDFFDCRDVPGYIAALRDMAREQGISVPLIACAGQGDLGGAWAGIEGVSPAINLYMSPAQPELESDLAAYQDGLGRLGHPILVTETGREVLLLRRLLASGAKLLGPYNQVAGYDFGFTASVNNWGSPLAFQTTHYDFDSLVGSFGEVRENAWEDKALSGLLGSLGPVIAAATPCWDHGIRVEASGRLPCHRIPALRLHQDGTAGYALAITNVGDTPLEAMLVRGEERRPSSSRLTVEACSSAFAFFNLSLAPWGLPGTVLFSSAEPFALQGGENPVFVFQSTGEAEVRFDLGDGERVFRFDGKGVTEEEAPIPGGGTLRLYGIGRRDSLGVSLSERGVFARTKARRPRRSGRAPLMRWRISALRQTDLFPPADEVEDGRPLNMELHGACRGYALYAADLPPSAASALGVLLHGAADILSAYLNGRYLGTRVPGGADAFFPFPAARTTRDHGRRLEVRAEIWGHSNFDDPRMPALRLGSMRGFSKATLLTRKEQIALWNMDAGNRECGPLPYLSPPGSRLTGGVAPRYRSSCTVIPDSAGDRFLLRVEEPECPTIVRIDGSDCGWVDRYHPTLDVSDAVRPGRPCRIALEPQKWYAAEALGATFLLHGTRLEKWSIAGAEERELADSSGALKSAAEKARFPLSVGAGGMAWLYGSFREDGRHPCLRLVFRGRDIKASVLFNGRLVGRLFLETEIRPKMAGGRDDLAYLPSCWFSGEGNRVSILLEAVGSRRGRLDSIEAQPVD
jgi:beta-galactosidase